MDKTQQDYEINRLNEVYKLITDEILERDSNALETKNEIVSMRKSFWNVLSSSNDEIANLIEIAQNIDQLGQEQLKYEHKKVSLAKLIKLKSSPYFSRIDFTEKGENSDEKIYIGLSSFIDYESGNIYIYDWRSPISSIFYEFETGDASYNSPEGIIYGKINMKRQFRIYENKIEYMFDSNLKIDDEILQEILGKSADDKMKNIVTSIQKEQNRIIRDDTNNIVIVQGAAGSGKTSIALHRVAYLLYKHREMSLTSDNIVIFSPNQMFNDYISDVLPELGEENINQTTFFEYIRKFIGFPYIVEDFNEQMEFILSSYDSPNYMARISGIKYKSSPDFLKVLDNYINYIMTDYIKFKDIIYEGKLILSKEELKQLFDSEYIIFPAAKRLNKIRDRIYYQLNPEKKIKTEEKKKYFQHDPDCIDSPSLMARLTVLNESKPLMHDIENMTTLNVFSIYQNLFEDRRLFEKLAEGTSIPENMNMIMEDTILSLMNNLIHYEDAPAYLYLKNALDGIPNLQGIKHVVIDEAQDLNPIQYKIISQLFKYSSMTILGDLNQSIHPYMNIQSLDILSDIFNVSNSSIFKLFRTYRSTKEIVEFTKELLPESQIIEYINRPGDKPSIRVLHEDWCTESLIARDIAKLSEKYKSIAVICKTDRESRAVYKKLLQELKKDNQQCRINLIDKNSSVFVTGIVVIPSYLSKGLEFDAVLVYDGSVDSYSREEERKLFYTICTRALHKLIIYSKGAPSYFINDIDKSLYEKSIL